MGGASITQCDAILFASYRRFPMSAVAENIQTEMPAPILFTDSAAAKVADLIAEEETLS